MPDDGDTRGFGDAWWAHEPHLLINWMQSSLDGLSSEDAERRRKPAPVASSGDQRRALAVALSQLRNPLVLLLLSATLIASLVGSFSDAGIILVILALSGFLGFWQEYRAARDVEALLSRLQASSRVRRDGAPLIVPSSEVVPGDILLLRAGDLIPADARLVTCEHLFTIEAPLTGEPFPVEKAVDSVDPDFPIAARASAVWAGTSVRSGTAEAIVMETGLNTVFGAIAAKLSRREPETAFSRGLRRFGVMISELVLVIALIVEAVNLALGRPFFDSLTFALALAVGMTPQMLPAILAVTLASGARGLAQRGVIVRKLDTIEVLGSMNVLCVDKTGTLTRGVVELYDVVTPDGTSSERVRSLAFINAELQSGLDNPLDTALSMQARTSWTDKLPVKLAEVPFDFARRRLSVVVAQDHHALMITKGAALPVLEICTHNAGAPLDAATRESLTDTLRGWSEEGLRVLAIATRVYDRRTGFGPEDETAMDLQGFVLLRDPLRDDAADMIDTLRAHGIGLRIVTGDNRFVAKSVAQAVGLQRPEPVTGEQVAMLGADALSRIVSEAEVFAEVDPASKERIVTALRKAGHVTGFLGDGINDATALRLADIGLSVEGATDVAREAADMVLTSAELSTVLAAVEKGRRAFANTQKYLRIATAASFGNMVSMALASMVLPFLPMTAGQILLANLLTDLPMLALASDRVDAVLRERPHRWALRDLLRFMAIFGLISSLFDAAFFFAMVVLFHAPPELFRTTWFLESLLTELVFTLVIRTQNAVWASCPSAPLWGLTLGVGGLAFAMPWLPGAGVLGFLPLPTDYVWFVCGIVAAYGIFTESAKRLWIGKPKVRRHATFSAT
ncbi:magnesium-translocating P-type ATPase [Thioclava sp. F42-5]|uniref:magnesium-translocating P-type ATPase n=1 Tax=Thioclava sp. F42-5 TaxID=1973005 RepID=UPI000B5397C7|nr:magnesium-translocating P-type ATPase [Thioclava sp. F42-5]OWY10498.1 magnesium-translocating P-type ATPase [Thioclava sp. F42-5]